MVKCRKRTTETIYLLYSSKHPGTSYSFTWPDSSSPLKVLGRKGLVWLCKINCIHYTYTKRSLEDASHLSFSNSVQETRVSRDIEIAWIIEGVLYLFLCFISGLDLVILIIINVLQMASLLTAREKKVVASCLEKYKDNRFTPCFRE